MTTSAKPSAAALAAVYLLFALCIGFVGLVSCTAQALVKSVRSDASEIPSVVIQGAPSQRCDGKDCIDYFQEKGVYCDFAANMAAVGAYLYVEKHLPLERAQGQLSLVLDGVRPLTEQEQEHAFLWIKRGWELGHTFTVLQAREAVRSVCLTQSGREA